MAGGINRKISAASARAHTRRAKRKQSSSLQLPPGILHILLSVLFVGIFAWGYQAIQPPPSKTCGSPDGPPVTAPRIKLKDGRHLAYKEIGVSKDVAKFNIVFIHGFDSCRLSAAIPDLSSGTIEELGVYIVSFDRPGYGESDPHPGSSVKSLASDVEELADQLELGSRFYVIGISLGGELTWSCLKYIPHRLAGAALLAPVTNYWWPHFPANLSKEAFNRHLPADKWAFRVAHYAPWLTYWWNTRKWLPASDFIRHNPDLHSSQDKEIAVKFAKRSESFREVPRQQGEFESIHRDLNMAFGNWEFDPLELGNPFPNNEGSVHIWQGDEDRYVPVTLQRYIAQQLPWIQYHELPGSGHLFPLLDGMSETIVKLLIGQTHD